MKWSLASLSQSLAERSPRERQILLAGIGIGVPMLVWLLIWQPLLNMNSAAAQRVEQRRATLTWMQQASAQVRALQGQGAQQRTVAAPNQFITREAARLNLQINRIEPVANNRFNIWLAQADYLATVRLLDALHRQGFSIDSLNLAKQGEAGMVSVRLSVRAGA